MCYWPSGLPSRNSSYDGFGDWEIQEYGACYWVSGKGPLFYFEASCLFPEYSWIRDRDTCRADMQARTSFTVSSHIATGTTRF